MMRLTGARSFITDMSQKQEYKLAMVPGSVPDTVHISEKDAGLRRLAFRLLLSGEPFIVPGLAAVQIVGRKANGETFVEDAEADGDQVTVAVTSDMSDTAGPCICRIVLSVGDEILPSQLFTLMVEVDPIHGITPDTDEGYEVSGGILYAHVVGPYVENGILYGLPDASVTGGILNL